eukprot:3705178-Prymnesium_polylepis.1
MLLDNWMWNNGKSPTPFQLDAEYPNVVVVQLEQVGAHAANCTTPGLGASLQPLGIEPQADAAPHHAHDCGDPDGMLDLEEQSRGNVTREPWACLRIEGSLDTSQPLGELHVVQTPEGGLPHPEVALRCIEGEAPSSTWRESGWVDHGLAQREDAGLASAEEAGDGVGGVEKECLLDFRPLDGLELSARETANTPTADQTSVVITLRHWWPGALVTLTWPEASEAFEVLPDAARPSVPPPPPPPTPKPPARARALWA